LADAHAGVIGALHAGWRGVLAGIVNEGIAAMCRLGASPSRIRAAAGPAIGRCCFEVDNDLGDRFVREVAVAERHRTNGPPGKAMLDLSAIVRDQLVDAGVAPSVIALTPECTRCSSDRYFSRRAAGGASTGLQLSFIALRP
jgi:YfiH family protein